MDAFVFFSTIPILIFDINYTGMISQIAELRGLLICGTRKRDPPFPNWLRYFQPHARDADSSDLHILRICIYVLVRSSQNLALVPHQCLFRDSAINPTAALCRDCVPPPHPSKLHPEQPESITDSSENRRPRRHAVLGGGRRAWTVTRRAIRKTLGR